MDTKKSKLTENQLKDAIKALKKGRKGKFQQSKVSPEGFLEII